ncbi:5-hydroxyisourate hydrolase-like isoform X1 [Petaurus breviceps papuanus]|uniref:5-hydroxyisourate hydrolase-like isoform X1 n=1 Tax=Petaurus breviceps papuanus TaxID=3040969 RepID=UPI0036D7FDD1
MSAQRLHLLKTHLCPTESRGMEVVSSPLTTHVLDTTSGLPARGLCLRLFRLEDCDQQWTELRKSYTNVDGRCPGLLTPEQMKAGTYKLFFDTEGYWKKMGQVSFYPYVEDQNCFRSEERLPDTGLLPFQFLLIPTPSQCRAQRGSQA